MTETNSQTIIEQAINVPFMDTKNMSKLIDSYIKYNLFSRFKHPDMLCIFSISEIDYPDFEYCNYEDETYKVYYFWSKGKICFATRKYERVELLYSKKEDNIGYINENNEWFSGYDCHVNKDRWIFIERSHYSNPQREYNTNDYIPIKAYEINDTYQSFSEFKDSLLKRFHTISKIIKRKGVEFYYELSVSFNNEMLFSIKDSYGTPTINNLKNYKKEVEWWTSLLQPENESEIEIDSNTDSDN